MDRTPPELTLCAPTTTTDTSPGVRVTAFDRTGLPNDLTEEAYQVQLDVDLDGDGAFSGNELGYTQVVLHDDHAVFEVRPALVVGTYRMRARLMDQAGNEGCSPEQQITITALGSWSLTTRHLTWDPLDGRALEAAGDATITQPFDAGAGEGGCACACGGTETALVYHSSTAGTVPVLQATLQAVTQTRRYRWSVSVAFPGTPSITVPPPATGSTFLVSQDASPIAPGWSFAMIDRLYVIAAQGGQPAGILREYRAGGWRFYEDAGGGSYTSPGNDRGTLARTGSPGSYTYTYTDTAGNQGRFQETLGGRQDRYTSADGHEVTAFDYNGDGTLKELTTPDATKTTFTYNSGQLSTIAAPGGRVTTTSYSGGVFQVIDPEGGVRGLTYTSGRITQESYGHTVGIWGYTGGLASAYSRGDGAAAETVSVAPAAAQGLSALAAGPARAQRTDGLGHATRYTFDERGRPLTQLAGDGGLTTWARDAGGFVTAMTDPLGRTTSYARDAATGYVTQETLPDGATRSSTYASNVFHSLLTSTDERGNVTSYGYDAGGHRVSERDALGQRSTQVYSSSTGLLERRTDRRGVTTVYHYDPYRRLDAMMEGLAPFDAGTSTSNSNTSTTLADSTRNWITNGLAGLQVVITGGKGVGQARTITGNSATQLTASAAWDTGQTPDSTSAYAIPVWTGTATGSSTSTTLQQGGAPGWTVNGWAGSAVFITGGTGAGQRRLISGNTADTLTVAAWSVVPDATSTYAIVPASATEYRLTSYFYNAKGHQEVVVAGQSPFNPHVTVTQTVYDKLGRVTQSVEASNVYQTGISSGGNTSTTLKDTSHRWGQDAWAGRTVVLVGGTGAGQSRVIASNTADTLTVGTAWTATPDATSKYEITLQSGTATGAANGTAVTLSDSNRSWSTNQWTGLAVLITGGTGAGQTRLIKENTATQLTLTTPWATVPDTTSTYAIVPAERRVSTTEYGDPGNVELVTDPLGRQTRYLYDSANRVVEVREAEGTLQQRSTRTSYDAAGNVSQVRDPLNRKSTVEQFDPLNRATESVTAAGTSVEARSRMVYDLVGRVVSSYDPLGRQTSDVYDLRDRMTRMNEAVGRPEERASTTSYDAAGNVIAATTGLAAINPFVVTTRSAYDALNRRTVTLEAANALVYGTSSGGNANTPAVTLNDTSQSWATNQWAGRAVRITSGTGAGQTRQVLSNTANQLTLTAAWTAIPDSTSTYEVLHQVGTSTGGNGDLTLNDTGKSWATNAWANQALVITGGTGAGQYRRISANTATQLTVAEKWAVVPDATSAYEIMDPLRVSTTTYDPEGNVVSGTAGIAVTNPFVVTSRTTYDALGRATVSASAANVFDSGITADGNPSNALSDPSKAWATNQWAGRAVLITAGKGAGQSRQVTANTATQLTVATSWDTGQVSDHTSRYEIVPVERHASVTVYDAAGQVLRSSSGYGGDPALNHLVTTASSYDMLGRTTHTLEAVLAGGQSTGGNTTTTLNDTTQSWGTNAYAGLWVFLTDGTGRGQVLQVTSNTATQLTLNGSWNPVPDATSTYAVLNAEKRVTASAFDAVGNVTEVTNPLGRKSAYAYDALNRQQAMTLTANVYATGTATGGTAATLTQANQAWHTDQWAGKQVRIIAGTGNGQVRTISTNTADTLTVSSAWTTNPGATSQFEIILASGTATGGAVSTLTHSGQTWATNQWVGRLLRITSGPGAGQERLISSNTADTLTVSAPWNAPAPGNTSGYEIVVIERRTTKTAYDPNSRTTAVTDPALQTARTAYDEQDRPVKAIDARQAVQKTVLDVAGQARATTDPVGNRWTYDLDGLGRVVKETNSLDDSRLFTYDAAGHLTERTDRRGLKRAFGFDLLGRNTSEVWKDASGATVRTLTFTFDAGDNLLTASDPDSSYAYTYDLQGRPKTISNAGTTGSPTVVLTAGYLADGLRGSMSATVNSGADFSNTYGYDAVSRLTQVVQAGTNTAAKRVDLAYNALDQSTTITRYRDTAGIQLVATSAYAYDPTDRLQTLTHTGATARPYTFVWDGNDRLAYFAFAPDGSSTYSHDRSDQLTTADHTYQTDEGYSYDQNGNRTNAGYQTGPENRLLSDGTYAHEYDDEGNRTRKSKSGEVWDYEWDYRNRLTKVTLRATVGGAIQKEFAYTYDVADRRIGKSVDDDGPGGTSPVVTRFVYDGAHIALASTGSSQLRNRYLHGAAIDQIFADEQITSGPTIFI